MLRAGWRLRWSSTEAQMRTREKATHLRAGLGEWAECRGGGAAQLLREAGRAVGHSGPVGDIWE